MAAATAEPSSTPQQQPNPTTVVTLKPVDLTPELFSPFGQVVGPTHDGKEYDADDAQLQLNQGQPR